MWAKCGQIGAENDDSEPTQRKNPRLTWDFSRAPDRNRTCDLWYRKPTLYPLSYGGVPIEVTTPATSLPSLRG